jgi:hypothetical protein
MSAKYQPRQMEDRLLVFEAVFPGERHLSRCINKEEEVSLLTKVADKCAALP